MPRDYTPGIDRSHDLPWSPQKAALILALQALKAYDPDRAVLSREVQRVSGLSRVQVRYYAYHARAGGLLDVLAAEGLGRGRAVYLYHLTSKGARIDPVAELRNQPPPKKKPRKKKLPGTQHFLGDPDDD